MEVLALLIPLSIVLVGAALWFFVWASDNDQFEDLDHHAMDIFDDTATDNTVAKNTVLDETEGNS